MEIKKITCFLCPISWLSSDHLQKKIYRLSHQKSKYTRIHTLEILFSYYMDLQAHPLSMSCSLLTHRREPKPNVLAHTCSLILFNTWKVPVLDSFHNWFSQSPSDGRYNKQSHCEAMLADFGGGTVVVATSEDCSHFRSYSEECKVPWLQNNF